MTILAIGEALAEVHDALIERTTSLEFHRRRTAETFKAVLERLDLLRADVIEWRDKVDADMAAQITEEAAVIGAPKQQEPPSAVMMAAE